MSEDTVAKMRILGPTEAPTVSTIPEEMFQYFDGNLRRHSRTIKRPVRLRLSLIVFSESGYARLDVTSKPSGMVIPTAKL